MVSWFIPQQFEFAKIIKFEGHSTYYWNMWKEFFCQARAIKWIIPCRSWVQLHTHIVFEEVSL